MLNNRNIAGLSDRLDFRRVAYLIMWLLLVCSGCIEGRKSTHELEHITPVHWPANLSDAADKLEERVSQLDEANSARELREIIDWIPEIAADVPMPESRWSELFEHCESLAKLSKQAASNRSNYIEQVRQLAGQLRACHAELPQPVQPAGDESETVPTTEEPSN